MRLKKVFYTLTGIVIFVWMKSTCQFPIPNVGVVFPSFALLTLFCYTGGALTGALVGGVGSLVCNILLGLPLFSIGVFNNLILGVVLGRWFTFIKSKQPSQKKKKRFRFFIFTPIIKCLPDIFIIGGTFGILLVLQAVVYSVSRGYPFETLFSSLINQYILNCVVVLISIPFCKLVSSLLAKVFKQ